MIEQTVVLIVAAVEAEREAVMRGIGEDGRFEVIATGGGPVAAAVRTALRLAASPYRAVVNVGIAGAFPGVANIGDVVLADESVAADLGAETPDGFRSVETLGFGVSRLRTDGALTRRIANALRHADIPAVTGPIATVSTATGTAETADELRRRIPGVVAEAMEGFGVVSAAQACGIPALEIRAASNLVGPRNREAWRIAEALEQLSKVGSILREVRI